ncbi:YybH family protein [Streptomyces lydicus]|uniref:YybH family protein n=1 Tax=Streptomyces lydicus TaxID=47763 RepID=UPI00378FA131
MSDLEAIADRIEIEALRAEFTDAVMMRDYDRLASLFATDGVWRIPGAHVEFTGPREIRAGIARLQHQWEYFVQTAHPGTLQLEGDTASGRAYIQELGRMRDGRSGLNRFVAGGVLTVTPRTASTKPRFPRVRAVRRPASLPLRAGPTACGPTPVRANPKGRAHRYGRSVIRRGSAASP